MIGSSDNSGGVVVGALVCGTECSGFCSALNLASYFDFFFFSLVEFFLSSCEPAEPFQHGASIACCILSFCVWMHALCLEIVVCFHSRDASWVICLCCMHGQFNLAQLVSI